MSDWMNPPGTFVPLSKVFKGPDPKPSEQKKPKPKKGGKKT